MDNNISLRIYIRDGKLEHIVPEFPWEGQVNVEAITYDEHLDPASNSSVCQDRDCPEVLEHPLNDLHYHEYSSTAVIRAER
jgi:hypothetical protein